MPIRTDPRPAIAAVGARRPLTTALRHWVLSAFPRDGSDGINYDQPLGDPGLFDPAGPTWRIHSDFPGMLAGGLAALMLQTLHPLALAGVWDHSNFRSDLVGRLRRTTSFVGGTTYAPRAASNAMIAKVRAIHDRVHGTSEDGRPYDANDPHLLTWVHVTEAHSFLQGYRRYANVAMPVDGGDRYYDEVRRVAEALGARDVPRSETEVEHYFARMQSQLAYTERSRTVLAILARVRLPVPLPGLSRDAFMHAGAALLPPWALQLLGRTAWQQTQDRVAARALASVAPLFRHALQDGGIVARACQRVNMPFDDLQRWPQ